MKLTKVERLMLINQYKILAKLYPGEEKSYTDCCEILENGYEYNYIDIYKNIDDKGMSKEECSEVMDILTMFDCLQRSYKALSDKTGIEEQDIKFLGFDGNNEIKQMGYVQFLLSQEKFIDVIEKNVNSHCSMLGSYQNKFSKYRQISNNQTLSRDEIIGIISNT